MRRGHAWAARALAWLDDVAWDGRHGGYWGSFRRDNERYAAGTRLPTPDGRDIFGLSPGFKEINTQGDAIEMLTSFVERGAGRRCADRLEALTGLVADRLIDSHGVMPYAYRPDWRPVPDLLRVGYQFMMARHLALVPGEQPRMAELVARSCQLVDFCLASARHPGGGFCLAVTADGRSWPATGPSSDLRQWWVQLEALSTFHLLPTTTRSRPRRRPGIARNARRSGPSCDGCSSTSATAACLSCRSTPPCPAGTRPRGAGSPGGSRLPGRSRAIPGRTYLTRSGRSSPSPPSRGRRGTMMHDPRSSGPKDPGRSHGERVVSSDFVQETLLSSIRLSKARSTL